jgi:hypothetical protein
MGLKELLIFASPLRNPRIFSMDYFPKLRRGKGIITTKQNKKHIYIYIYMRIPGVQLRSGPLTKP